MLGDAKEELKKLTTIQTNTNDLRTRFEDDFDFVRNEKFEIPKKEGEWESFTSNRPSTDAGKTINTLASSRLMMKILLADENEKERKNLSKTERFPYGVIALRDELLTGIPEALPLQPSLAWHAVVRGWIGLLCYLYEDDGRVIPHIPSLDILNTYWITGSRGLLWFCTQRYASPEDVKDQFGEDVKPDSTGRVKLHNVWDKESFGTAAENEWLGGVKTHDLRHIPVLILPVGSTPLVQSGKHTDTIKNVGMSFASNNRLLYETESRMGSYLLTMAGMAAKAPVEAQYDSRLSGKPIELEGSRVKGSVVPVDVGRGQKIATIVTPEMTRDAYAFFEFLGGQLARGGHVPIAFGESPYPSTAAGTGMLIHESLTNIKPPQRAMERAYEWLAHECVSQYKSGGFSEMEIQGMDGSSRRFKMEVKPDDIDDSWKFEAKLVAKMPYDDSANMGMAVQAVEAELMSRQTARDRYNLVDDTDLEAQILDREKAYRIAAIAMRRVAAALKEDGDEEGAQFILDAIDREEEKKGVASQPGTRTPVRPSGATTAATPRPPASPTARPSAARRFLQRLGG